MDLDHLSREVTLTLAGSGALLLAATVIVLGLRRAQPQRDHTELWLSRGWGIGQTTHLARERTRRRAKARGPKSEQQRDRGLPLGN